MPDSRRGKRRDIGFIVERHCDILHFLNLTCCCLPDLFQILFEHSLQLIKLLLIRIWKSMNSSVMSRRVDHNRMETIYSKLR